MLRLLHTADWHLGRRFPSFPEDAQKKLSRARMDVVTRILEVARRHKVHAIVVAGDVFDDPNPGDDFWQGLAKILRGFSGPYPPLFFVPGNHDPLAEGSVWSAQHPFRAQLPSWVHVVDRDDFSFELAPHAVLYARPCRSKAGENDLALLLPAREPGDQRIRIGCVHGSTFDIEGHQTNFPISRSAGTERGLDYLAIGDTHSFRDATAQSPVPTVYPGAPEPTGFDDPGAGNVVLVAMFRRGLRPRLDAEPVAFWRWRELRCRQMDQLRNLLAEPDLERSVVRLRFEMTVSMAEEHEVDRIVRTLQGTDATHGRAGVLIEDRSELHLHAGSHGAFPDNLPAVLRDTVDRLDRMVEEAADDAGRNKATRALAHLYQLIVQRGLTGGDRC